jgi:hypothetical protein
MKIDNKETAPIPFTTTEIKDGLQNPTLDAGSAFDAEGILKRPYHVISDAAKQNILTAAVNIFTSYLATGQYDASNEDGLITKAVSVAIKIDYEVTKAVKTVSR